jgi:hypothetical protein
MLELRVSKKELELWGANSLEGCLAIEGYLAKEGFYQEPIRILFEQWSPEKVEAESGPDMLLLPEYLPLCLCESVISLTQRGVKLEFGVYYK